VYRANNRNLFLFPGSPKEDHHEDDFGALFPLPGRLPGRRMSAPLPLEAARPWEKSARLVLKVSLLPPPI
jgi:hypothetical protein